MATWTPLPVYEPQRLVPYLFDFGLPFRDAPYTPAPLRWGPICDACWMRDQMVRPLSSALCPHGGPS